MRLFSGLYYIFVSHVSDGGSGVLDGNMAWHDDMMYDSDVYMIIKGLDCLYGLACGYSAR